MNAPNPYRATPGQPRIPDGEVGSDDGDAIGNIDAPEPDPVHTCEDRLDIRLRRRHWQWLRAKIREVRELTSAPRRKFVKSDTARPDCRIKGEPHRWCVTCRGYRPAATFSEAARCGKGSRQRMPGELRRSCDRCAEIRNASKRRSKGKRKAPGGRLHALAAARGQRSKV